MVRLWCTLAIALALGCSGFIDRKAAQSTYKILEKSFEAARRQRDLGIAREAMPGGLVQLEAFALAYPDFRGFRVLHAESICQYAIGFVFDDWEDATLGGRTAEAAAIAERLDGLLAMCTEANVALLPAPWREAHARGDDALVALLPKATRAEVPALLWIASAGAVRLALNPLAGLAKLPAITAVLRRCVEVAPGYHDADGEILLGTLAAARAAFPGSRDDGSAWFERARQRAGEGTLLVEVMFARGTAVARRDPALFDATLARVLAADVTRWPDRRLANELARRKARRFQAARATLLPGVTEPAPASSDSGP